MLRFVLLIANLRQNKDMINVIGVNTPPVLDVIGDKVGDELSMISFTVSASDIDIPVQQLTYSFRGAAPAGATIDPVTGLFEWVPTEAQGGIGPAQITIEVSDGIQTDSETIEILVNEVNVAPTITTIPAQVTDEEVLFEYDVTVTDPDIPANTHTFSLGGSVPAGLSGTHRSSG